MENLKLTIDDDKKQIAIDRANTKEDMGYAKKYRDEAREDKMAIEQVKEDIREKVEAVNSLLSNMQDQSKTVVHVKTDADKDVNVQIRNEYVEPND